MKIIILLPLFIFLFCYPLFSQTAANSDSSGTPKLKPSQVVATDTLPFMKDTLQILLPAKSSDNKVFFIKDSKSSTLFKDLLPILTLFLGILINQLITLIQDKRKIKKSGERWVAELRGMDEPIQQQVDILNTLLQEAEDVYEPPELSVGSTLNCEIFKSLDKSELLKYTQRKEMGFFQRKTKDSVDRAIKTSNQTHGLINALTHLHESLQEKFKDFLNGWSQHTSVVNRNLQLLSEAFAWYGVDLELELNGNPVNDPRYKPILNLFNEHIEPHRKDGKYNLFELQEHFFWPLIQLLGHMRHDVRLRDMNKYTGECFNAIKGIRMEKQYWRKNIGIISKRYNENLSLLRETIIIIENGRE